MRWQQIDSPVVFKIYQNYAQDTYITIKMNKVNVGRDKQIFVNLFGNHEVRFANLFKQVFF